MFLIVGLGNPGRSYRYTRHNVGFMVIDRLREQETRFGFPEWKPDKKFQAELSGTQIDNEKIILAKPMTYMNESGVAVQKIASYYQIPRDRIIVIHDDKDLDLGTIRVQTDRGHAGHNGVKSIFQHIGQDGVIRIRVGIKSTNERKMRDVPKFVLGKFGFFERGQVEQMLDLTVRRIMELIRES